MKNKKYKYFFMDAKNILNKIDECKKDIQKKELFNNLKYQMANPKNKKVYEQLLKLNYEKTLNKLYTNKEFDMFLELIISIIQYLSPLSEAYRKKYQDIILELIIPKKLVVEEEIKINLNYFLIATNNLDDIANIKYKKYLVYFLFFNILLKIKLDSKIIDLFMKLDKYMTKYQYEIIINILIIYSLAYKNDDFGEQMITLKKIIEFCKFDFSNANSIYNKNIDLIKNIFIMLLSYTPFKQEILINTYKLDPNYFMSIIQDIIINLNNILKDDENNIINENNTDLISINNFFHDEIISIDFDFINSKNDIISNYFNDRDYFIKKYNKFIENIQIKNILSKNKIDIYKGIIWTLSSIILKNYYDINSSSDNINNNIFDENKNHCIRLLNSLISIFQYTNIEEQKNFIKQYLELVKSIIKEVNIFEEWSYVLDIIKKCCRLIIVKEHKKERIEKEYKNEINILNEIFNIILNCYNKKELLFCDIEYLSSILHSCIQFLKNDSLLCFYIDIYLTKEHKNKKYIIKNDSNNENVYNNFINNLEIVLFNIFSLSPKLFSKTKNYLLEIIRVNYLNDSKILEDNNRNNNMSKQIIIEKILEKYLENIFISSGDNEQNYSFFNYTLMEILCKSHNIDFLNQILTLLIFNSNEKINKTLYSSFVSSIIINLFQNLINNPSKCNLVREKLSFLIDFFFDEINMNDENILNFGLSILKYFVINNQYEIIFVKNLNNSDVNNQQNNHSLLVIDYLYYKIILKKLTFENEKEFITFHKNFYAPYIVFPHVRLFKAINQNLENYITKTYILESILEFYYLCFSNNILFLKNVNLNLFFKTFFEEKELSKISHSKKITNLLLKILSCLPYQLNNDISFNRSTENIELKLKDISNLKDDIQLNFDSKYKISVINFLINFWSNLNSMIFKTLNKIFSNEQFNQTNFNFNYEDKKTLMSIYNLLSKGDSHLWCGELNLYAQFEYLYDCINLLKFYLISCSNEYIQSDINNIKSIRQNKNRNNNRQIFSALKDIIQKIIIEIFNSLNFKYFNKKYTYCIISLLYEMKELLAQFISEDVTLEIKAITKKSFSYSNIKNQYNKMMDLSENKKINEKEMKGINIIYKTIFISLFLSWNCEDKIIDTFDKILGTKYKSNFSYKNKFISLIKFFDQKKNFDESLQNLIEHFSDIFNLYLMQFIPEKNTSILINIVDEIFYEHRTYREYYFYKMAEWCLKIRKNREGININYKNIFDMNYLNNINNNYITDEYIGQKVLKNSYVFSGNNSLIIINPISVNQFSFSLRNPICNINLIFDSDVPIINNIENNINDSEDSILNEEEEEDDNDDNLGFDKKDNEESNISLSSDSNDSKNKEDFFLKNENDKNKIFEFEEGNEEKFIRRRKISEDYSNMNFDLNNKHENKKSKEFEDKINNRNNFIYPLRRKRFNTDLGDKYKKSMMLAEKKKIMKNCLKLFSILTELTDFKIEQYKWFDIIKNNNLYNITKLIQNLDMIPLYFIHNCAIVYHPEKNSESSANDMAIYMNFIQKLGILCNYNDLYPDYNYNKKNNNNITNADSEKYIIINQDSFTRVNFNILKLTEKDENKIIDENNIIFYWKNDNFNGLGTTPNPCSHEKKFKIFFIITRITDNLYKIQRKYNTRKKEVINYLIDELFSNEFIIDIENQSAIQMLINLIKSIDIIIKIYIKNETNKNKNIILENQNIRINEDKVNDIEEKKNNLDVELNYINESELMNENYSPLMKRYKLMSKL